MTTPKEPVCPLCDKRGLLIVPTIYALARSDAGKAPKLQAPFASSLNLPESAHLTLRLPRTSYLYVYDEARNQWTGHTINPQGYLMPFDPHQGTPPVLPNVKFNEVCIRKGDPHASRCIAVKDADAATKLWLGLSDTPWTPRVLKLHADAGYRQAHMRCIDVGAWVKSKGGATQPHVAGLDTLGTLVAEYVPNANASLKTPAQQKALSKQNGDKAKAVWEQGAFGFSVTTFHEQAQGSAIALATWATAQSSPIPPMLVAIDDPAGVAADLNGLAMQRMAEWLELDSVRKWKRATSLAIDALSEAVKNQAVEERRQEEIEAVDKEWGQSSMAGFSMAMANRLQEEIGKVNRRIARGADDIGNDAWAKYRDGKWYTSKSYDEAKRKADDATFNAALAAFDKQTITPLSSAWLSLTQSAPFKAHFTHNHDPHNINSGKDYLKLALLCVKDACGRSDVRKALQPLLAADPADRDNIWARALILDQDKAIAKLAEATELENEREVPWREMGEKLNEAFKEVIGHGIQTHGHFHGMLEDVAKYVYQISGPIASTLGKAMDAGLAWGLMKLPEKRLLSVLSWMSQEGLKGKRLVFVSSDLTPRQSARQLAGIMAEIADAPRNGLQSAIRGIVNDADRSQPYMGEDTGTPSKFRFVALIDEDVARQLHGMQSSALRAERAGVIQQAIALGGDITPEQMDVVVRNAVKNVTNSEFRLGLAGLLFAGWGLAANWGKDVIHGGAASRSKYAISASGALGTMTEMVGLAGKGTKWGAKALDRPIQTMILQAETRAELVAGVGKIMGAAAGIVLGLWELGEGWHERKENPSLGALHMASGFASAAIGSAILFGWLTAGVGFVLFIAVAVITYIASFFADDKFQAWLRKCYYGTNEPVERYQNLLEQQAMLDTITGQTNPEESLYKKTFDKLSVTQSGFVGTKL
ncbi:MAG: hypothetical protein EPN68_01060 [Rhodanobacter sp.]|nr:MAG: hypothetical protein EPN68_01060 [Rhodanobacter sp.]